MKVLRLCPTAWLLVIDHHNLQWVFTQMIKWITQKTVSISSFYQSLPIEVQKYLLIIISAFFVSPRLFAYAFLIFIGIAPLAHDDTRFLYRIHVPICIFRQNYKLP